MAIYKNSIKVVITTGAGFSATADDSVTAGVGAAVAAMIQNGQDVEISDGNGGCTFIPFHAIDHAVITLTRAEAEAPADETCVTP